MWCVYYHKRGNWYSFITSLSHRINNYDGKKTDHGVFCKLNCVWKGDRICYRFVSVKHIIVNAFDTLMPERWQRVLIKTFADLIMPREQDSCKV